MDQAKAENRNSIFAPVSVVVPCYRCTQTISRALLSVFHQTLKPTEIILVDDGNDSSTLAVLRNLEKEYLGWVRILQLKQNGGVAGARNAGWADATQPYVAFLDSDDAWHPKKIEIQYKYIESHSEIVLCGHKHRILSDQSYLPDWKVGECNGKLITKFPLLLSNPFITPSIMIKRNLPFRFLDGRRHMEDHLLWMQVACAKLPVYCLADELAAIYKPAFGDSGLSSHIHEMELADLANYLFLYRHSDINLIQLFGLSIYSILKYFRRLWIVQWRRILRIFKQSPIKG